MITFLVRIQNKIAGWLTPFQSALLLTIRLYWGGTLMISGWNKLTHFGDTISYLDGLGMPFAGVNAALSGLAELGGGLFLFLGLLSRPAAAVLTFNFVIAYIFGHPEAARSLFSHPADFISAPAFTYLFTSILILLFGSGRFSLDALLATKADSANSGGSVDRTASAGPADPASCGTTMSRRDLGALAGAAVGGIVAGSLLSRLIGSGEPPPTTSLASATPPGGSTTAADTGPIDIAGNASLSQIDAAAPQGVTPSYLLQEPHVCCGLNTCKSLGKAKSNSCAGQGDCATAETHVCQGLNTCKGQAGCGGFPGQNACKGKGACAVPLEKKNWVIARKRFEELMAKAKRSVGTPPATCKQSA